MHRRRFLLAGLGSALGLSLTTDARADTPGVLPRIGRLSPISAEVDARNLDAFRERLRDLGWVEGQSFILEARFADGKLDRLPALAADLVRQRVDLILTGSTPGALAAKRATATIPIVMVTTGDPVADGIVTSFARPGGNVTGVTALGQGLATKRLELIRDTVPGLKRVAVLIYPTGPYTKAFLAERDGAARTLGLDILALPTAELADAEKVLTIAVSERVGALMVQTDPIFLTHRRQIVEMVAKTRLPAIYGERQFVDAGGLMFYGASLTQMYRDAAVYADKILRGAKPADLPVEQPTKFDLVINLKTARALGLTIPPSLLLRADRVIDP